MLQVEIIVILLILIFIIWLYGGGFSQGELNSDQVILNSIEEDLQTLIDDSPVKISYRLVVNKHGTFTTNKKTIHLLIRNPETQRIYSHQTILRAAIHELAHVLCPEHNHTPLFEQYENGLLEKAFSKGLLPFNFEITEDYPCYEQGNID